MVLIILVFFGVSLEISLSHTQNVVPRGQQPFADG